MESGKLFLNAVSTPALDSFAYALLGLLGVLALLLFAGTRGRDTRVYDARMAWVRAWMYFCLCGLLSWITGVLPALLNAPLVNPAHVLQISWQLYMVFAWCIVLFGYLYIWPRGTVTYNRKLYPLPTVVIGLVWGLSEAQLFLSFWAIGERFIDTPWLLAGFTYVLVSLANAFLHVLYWDRYVSPDHNIYQWNMKKVALAHNPTIIVSLLYLVIWGDIWVYMLWPTFALLACALAQKFPAPWDTLAHGELEAQMGLCNVKTLSQPPEKQGI